MNHWAWLRPLIAGAAICSAAGGAGQLLPGGLGELPGRALGGLLPQAVDRSERAIGAASSRLDAVPAPLGLDAVSLLQIRRERLRALARAHRAILDLDDRGNPIRRGELIVIDASPRLLESARGAGFRELRSEAIAELDIVLTIFAPPKGKDTEDGLELLRKLDPNGSFELNHVFEPAGMRLSAGGPPRPSAHAASARIGMVDGGVAAHASLATARIEQRGFTAAGAHASGHGTAVASLLVGSDGKFAGAARGHELLVADVYGGHPAAGSAEVIARALGWLAARQVKVVNISLVGPPNALLERAVAALHSRGIVTVAAVGNDGPAAPPQYPASYPRVVAVTAVDARDKALPEAGRAAHIDFAAPGADMAAALPGRGYAAVRGTSFAAPLVAARIAIASGAGEHALRRVEAEAAPGKGRVGRGILCKPCRIDPRAVDAK